MSRLRLPRHRRAKLFALTTAGVALALALLAGCPATDRTSSSLRVLHGDLDCALLRPRWDGKV
jgi:hypothetical protein